MIFLSLASCSSNSIFLDTRNIDADEVRLYGGISVRGIPHDSVGQTFLVSNDLGLVPMDLVGAQKLTNRLDGIVRYTLPLTPGFGVRYSLTAMDKRATLAAGLMASVDLITLVSPETSSAPGPNVTLFETRAPLFIGINPSRYFSMTLIPNAVVRNQQGKWVFLSGANFNLSMGKRFGFTPEVSCLYNFGIRKPEVQLGAALFYSLPHRKGKSPEFNKSANEP